MLKEKLFTPKTTPVVERPENQAEDGFDIEILQNRLREIFESTKEKGWIQFEESKDPTGEHDENYRVMAFYVPEDQIEIYQELVESVGFEKDDEFENPNKFPDPGRYIRFTFPKYSFGIKKPDDGFMIFRIGFNVSQ
ncbi:MAG: hypothetical protein Q8R55_05240 [Candidatus Taylorbacteria bacterium]|nr:hypothetical protein [Candidatus Taylorbacteria bacterium]